MKGATANKDRKGPGNKANDEGKHPRIHRAWLTSKVAKSLAILETKEEHPRIHKV